MFKDKKTQRAYFRKYMLDRYHRIKKEWFDKNGPCIDCGSWENLEIDHIDPELKDIKLKSKGNFHTIWFWAKEKRESELAKCVARCVSCHKKRTIKQQTTQLEHRPIGRYWRPCRCKCPECLKEKG